MACPDHTRYEFLRIDARKSIYEQHRAIRQMFMAGERRPWAKWNTDAVMAWLGSRAGNANVETEIKERQQRPAKRK